MHGVCKDKIPYTNFYMVLWCLQNLLLDETLIVYCRIIGIMVHKAWGHGNIGKWRYGDMGMGGEGEGT